MNKTEFDKKMDKLFDKSLKSAGEESKGIIPDDKLNDLKAEAIKNKEKILASSIQAVVLVKTIESIENRDIKTSAVINAVEQLIKTLR